MSGELFGVLLYSDIDCCQRYRFVLELAKVVLTGLTARDPWSPGNVGMPIRHCLVTPANMKPLRAQQRSDSVTMGREASSAVIEGIPSSLCFSPRMALIWRTSRSETAA